MFCPSVKSARWLLCAAWLLVIVDPPEGVVRADLFKLVRGGQLQGRWLNEEQAIDAAYEIKTVAGVRVVLARSVVTEVIRESSLERQYQLEVERQGDDVDGHWAMAQWCRKHGMGKRHRYHLQHILRLDLDHAGARHGLGYSRVHGGWVTKDEYMRSQGYVLYRGRWQLPQQVDLAEAKRKRETAQRQWYRQLVQWRGDLGTERGEQASDAIIRIHDPFAVPGLAKLVQTEPLRPVRLLYVRALQNIGTPEALDTLLDLVLTDVDEEVVQSSLDCLVKPQHPLVIERLLKTLRHENNLQVNRAAMALARLKDDAAISPLIDALVTHHQVVVPTSRRGGQRQSVSIEVQNQDVLSALVQLTGIAGFGFDKKAWKQWRYLQVKHDHSQTAETAGLRRQKS